MQGYGSGIKATRKTSKRQNINRIQEKYQMQTLQYNSRPEDKTGYGKRTRPHGIVEENDQETEEKNRQSSVINLPGEHRETCVTTREDLSHAVDALSEPDKSSDVRVPRDDPP